MVYGQLSNTGDQVFSCFLQAFNYLEQLVNGFTKVFNCSDQLRNCFDQGRVAEFRSSNVLNSCSFFWVMFYNYFDSAMHLS